MNIAPPIKGESVVSTKGQTVIPKEVREALGIKEGSKLVWGVKSGHAYVYVMPDDPVEALRGVLKDSGHTYDDFIRQRNEERKRERLQDEREERRWRGTS